MSSELNAPAAIGLAVREAHRFDRSRVSIRVGLVAALPVVASLSLGTAIDRPDVAVTMGAGAMLGGVAWRAAGPDQPPLGTMAAAVLGLGAATVAGSATGGHPWLHLALLVALCVCAGLLVSVGRRGTVPGTQAIIAYIVFGRFPQPLGSAFGLAGLVMAGGALQAAFAATVALPPAWRQQRQALAEAYERLAALATNPEATSVPSAAALDAAEARLSAPALLGDPALMTLSSLVEEGRRIRLELIALRTRAESGMVPAARAEAVAGAVAAVLGAVAEAVADPRVDRTRETAAALAALDEAGVGGDGHGGDGHGGDGGGGHGGGGHGGDGQLAALRGQLQAATRLADVARHGRPWSAARPQRGSLRPLQRARSDLQQIRANASLGTAAGRHAARLSVVVAVAELLSQHAGLPRAYWAVVAAATVLRPEFGATFTRGAERMAGTVLGVVIATFIAVGLDPGGWGIVVVVGLLAWGTYAVFPASFAAGIALLTAMIVFLLHAVAPDSSTIALERGLDTVIGGVLGLVAYALWPTWSGGSTGRVMAELVEAQRAYVLAVLDCLVAGVPAQDEQLRPLARRARVAWSNADAVITLARSEPARQLGDPGTRAIATLGGLRRLVYAGHTLRLQIAAAERRPHAAWAPLRDGLGEALAAIAAQIRDADRRARAASLGPRPSLPPLRALYRKACAADRPEEALLAPLDELVDATNTVAATLGLAESPIGPVR